MLQHVIVFVIVAVCVAITVRAVYRVMAGKSSTCSLCDQCGKEKLCGSKTAAKPAGCPGDEAKHPAAADKTAASR